MEKLITSSSSISKPRHLFCPLNPLPFSSSRSTSLLPLNFKPINAPTKQDGPPFLRPLSFSQIRAVDAVEKKNPEDFSPIRLVKSTGFNADVIQKIGHGSKYDSTMMDAVNVKTALSILTKVSKSTVLILLSALLILVIQPILVQPAYATAVHSANKTFIKSELLSSAWTGFFAGCLHTLSGPDHLAALAPLSIGRTRVESAAVGALWGCGHDAGQLIFGLVFLLLKDRLHIETIQTWGTRVVGLTLLVIGAMGIKEASEIPMHYVSLENGDVNINEPKKKIGFATFATGIVHGLQPDALMMILPALALPSRKAGAAFLGMFLLGTVIAMGSYTVFIGSCSQALKDRIPRITEKLTWAASLLAISMGVAIIVSQFFGFSLY